MNGSNDHKKKNTSPNAAQAGFTLVEIAIVLVIIGLLLGGILKGQEMITQAKIKNVINDFNGVTAAVTSYQDRYRAVPGDDQNADTRWNSLATPPNRGSGNGIVAGLYNANDTSGPGGAPPAAAESNLFWQHLRIAGFIAGPTMGTGSGSPPPNATGGIIGVETGGAGTGMGFTSLIMCTSNLPDKVAIAVDTQVDDGAPGSGQVRGALQAAPNPATPATGNTTPYAETGTNQYLLCKNL
jgi:prepilin-type N-terminal cleavage/methylation domain-containing protein